MMWMQVSESKSLITTRGPLRLPLLRPYPIPSRGRRSEDFEEIITVLKSVAGGWLYKQTIILE